MNLNQNPSPKINSVHVAQNDLGMIDRENIVKPMVDITQGRHRSFVIGSSLLLFISHVPFFVIFIIYMVKKKDTNHFLHSYFLGLPDVQWVYAIICCVLFFLILILPSVMPNLGRKGLQIPLYPLLFICVGYMVAFSFMKQSQGKYQLDYDNIMLIIACAIYNASFGVFVTACFSIRHVPRAIGLGVSFGGILTCVLLLWLYSETTLRPMWEYPLYFLLSAGLSLYYSMDLEFMVRRRGRLYRRSDWFIGFIHLQTDLVYRFWVDLLTKPHKKEEITAELQVTEPEIQEYGQSAE